MLLYSTHFNSPNTKGYNQADEAARAATLSNMSLPHTLQGTLILQSIALSPSPDTQNLSYLHKFVHPNSQVLSQCIKTYLQSTSEDLSYLKSITISCNVCQTSNPISGHYILPFHTHRSWGSLPVSDWQLDLTSLTCLITAWLVLFSLS